MGLRIESRFFVYPLFFFYLILLLSPFSQAYCAGVLPDTGQIKCYNYHPYTPGEIPCPAPGESFYGQDGNYQGPQPAYQVSTDDLVVNDLNTGLIWQRADDGTKRNWAPASSYCEDLTLGGYSDWRLPSIKELTSIVDYGRTSPSINPAFDCKSYYYWSSSSASTDKPGYAWYVYFDYGASNNVEQGWFYVRCVRGGQ